MKLSGKHCELCELEEREQAGGVYIVVCKNKDCGGIFADETEANPHIERMEAVVEAANWIAHAVIHGIGKDGNQAGMTEQDGAVLALEDALAALQDEQQSL